jgi:hypothetical protein
VTHAVTTTIIYADSSKQPTSRRANSSQSRLFHFLCDTPTHHKEYRTASQLSSPEHPPQLGVIIACTPPCERATTPLTLKHTHTHFPRPCPPRFARQHRVPPPPPPPPPAAAAAPQCRGPMLKRTFSRIERRWTFLSSNVCLWMGRLKLRHSRVPPLRRRGVRPAPPPRCHCQVKATLPPTHSQHRNKIHASSPTTQSQETKSL